jgi:hypothetical protein
MNQNEIIKAIEKELERPTIGVVKQFLEIHEIEKSVEGPVVARIHNKPREKAALVYLAVKKEKFYFVIRIDLKSKKPEWAYTEIYSKLSLAAYSRSLSPETLQKLTKISATRTHRKGDIILSSKLKRKENELVFESKSVPGDFESHLDSFVRFLEKDTKGIKKLSTKAELQLHVMLNFHNGNGMIGGFSFSPDILSRLANMGIKMDFDVYATGNQFL